MKRLLIVLAIVLAPAGLAGCVTEQTPLLPMTLGPSEAAQATCLTYGDTPAAEHQAMAGTAGAENRGQRLKMRWGTAGGPDRRRIR